MSEQIKERISVSYGRCELCGHIAEYFFNDLDDCKEICAGCTSSADKIYKVIVWKA